MCVIIYKPKGVNLPTKEELKKCWDANPDGAGYAIQRSSIGEIEVIKGLMNFNTFYHSLTTKHIKINDTVVIHFRIATAGDISPEMTHPFPINVELKHFLALEYKTQHVFFHNGVVGHGIGGLSDTALYVLQHEDDLLNKAFVEKTTLGSKCLVLSEDDTFMTGLWHIENGLFYSNLYHTFDKYYFFSKNYLSKFRDNDFDEDFYLNNIEDEEDLFNYCHKYDYENEYNNEYEKENKKYEKIFNKLSD